MVTPVAGTVVICITVKQIDSFKCTVVQGRQAVVHPVCKQVKTLGSSALSFFATISGVQLFATFSDQSNVHFNQSMCETKTKLLLPG